MITNIYTEIINQVSYEDVQSKMLRFSDPQYNKFSNRITGQLNNCKMLMFTIQHVTLEAFIPNIPKTDIYKES